MNEVHRWITWQVEQLVDYSVMSGVYVFMVSVLLENTVQRDILEPSDAKISSNMGSVPDPQTISD